MGEMNLKSTICNLKFFIGPFMSDNDTTEHFCAKCGRLGQTCCQRTQIFLTRGDVARLKAAGADDIAEYAVPFDSSYTESAALDPVWGRIFGPDGRRRVIRHQAGGDCIFLGEKGCRFDVNTRPLVCRLYPFDYNQNAIKGVDAYYCPKPEADNEPLLLALLGMNRDEAEGWRKQLYAEIVEEFPD